MFMNVQISGSKPQDNISKNKNVTKKIMSKTEKKKATRLSFVVVKYKNLKILRKMKFWLKIFMKKGDDEFFNQPGPVSTNSKQNNCKSHVWCRLLNTKRQHNIDSDFHTTSTLFLRPFSPHKTRSKRMHFIFYLFFKFTRANRLSFCLSPPRALCISSIFSRFFFTHRVCRHGLDWLTWILVKSFYISVIFLENSQNHGRKEENKTIFSNFTIKIRH